MIVMQIIPYSCLSARNFKTLTNVFERLNVIKKIIHCEVKPKLDMTFEWQHSWKTRRQIYR